MRKLLFDNEIAVTLYGDNEHLKTWEEKFIKLLLSVDKELTKIFDKVSPEGSDVFGHRHALHTAGAIAYMLDKMGIKSKVYHFIIVEERVLYNHAFVAVFLEGNIYLVDMGRGTHRVNMISKNLRFVVRWKKTFLDTEKLMMERYLQTRGATEYAEFEEVPLGLFATAEQEFITGQPAIKLLNTIIKRKSNEMKQLMYLLKNRG